MQVKDELEDQLERLDFSNALTAIWKLVRRANRYVDETTPWNLVRDLAKRSGCRLYSIT